MRKKRILMVGEHNIAKSGFGLYTREILSRLHNTGKYEIAELSCFNPGMEASNVPWKVYPNAPNGNDPKAKELNKHYNSDPENVFGKWRFDQVCIHFKPDIVFDIRDFWMLHFEETSLLRPYFHWVVAPTVDSLPQKNAWMQTFSNADVALAHTDWAVNYMKNSPYKINAEYSVSDSVDPDVFKPINFSPLFNRANHLIPNPDKAFIIGSVMRNQKRKLFPNLLGVIKNLKVLTKNPNIYLYLHTSYPEKQGWSIPELLLEYGVYNNVLFTYYCPNCKKACALNYQGANTVCPFCKQKTAGFPNVVRGLTDNQLKNIYNMFDVYVQYAICEGLGIPQLEAAACGIPVMSVDYSAMSEVTTKLETTKIPYAVFKELETGAFRAVPDDVALIKSIYKYLELSPEQVKERKENIRAKLLENYNWDKTAKRYEELFDKLEPKNMWDTPLTIDPSAKVPEGCSHREFVSFIIKNVIQSPHLLRTNFTQQMIKHLDHGYVNTGGNIANYDRSQAKRVLESLLNHKALLEKLRTGKAGDSSEFLHYDGK